MTKITTIGITETIKTLAPALLLGAALLPLAANAQAPYGQGGRPNFRGARPNFGPNYQGGRPDFGPNPPADSRDVLGGPREFRGAQTSGGLRWEGDVDDTTLVTIRRGDVRTRTVSGKGASGVDARLFGFAPQRPVAVFLRRAEGRGRVRVVQQPSPGNDWTAVVRVYDPQPGRGRYAFELVWQEGDGGRGRDHYRGEDRGQGQDGDREDGRD